MAEFWIRNTTVAEYTINDLGMTLPASGEIDLHVHFSYDDIQRSSSLDTALSTGDLVRLDGEGGSTIPYADAYDDAVAPHEISGDAHTGSLDTDAVTEGDNLYYTEGRVSANTDVTANTSHRGSTSNPHTVTATQLSLNNVTNDAQLKRAAADISTFTEKTTPVSADLLLIEDSAATNAKKRVQIGNLPGAGPACQTATLTSPPITTTSTTYVICTGVTMTPAAGTYAVWFNGCVGNTVKGTMTSIAIFVDGTIQQTSERCLSAPDAAYRVSFASLCKVTVNGSQAIDARWKVDTDTSSMHEAIFMIIKVA